MKSKVKAFIAVVGVLLFVIAISLIIRSRGPLYGKDGDDNWVPDLIGRWTSEVAGYFFEDVTDPTCGPLYIEGPQDDFVITHQMGRTFAGTWYDDPNDPGDNKKLAGIMLPDRTMSIQDFEPSEQRTFITGRLTKSGGTLQISGCLHFFDDFHGWMPNPEASQTPPSARMMASGYISTHQSKLTLSAGPSPGPGCSELRAKGAL